VAHPLQVFAGYVPDDKTDDLLHKTGKELSKKEIIRKDSVYLCLPLPRQPH
jgi:hypothetical protein